MADALAWLPSILILTGTPWRGIAFLRKRRAALRSYQLTPTGRLRRRNAIPYLTGGQMIHPRRPVLRTRKRCPPMVVM
jgi:hypothetical protein